MYKLAFSLLFIIQRTQVWKVKWLSGVLSQFKVQFNVFSYSSMGQTKTDKQKMKQAGEIDANA